ncbi:MAG TPA: hypothetical protein VER11_23230 [Polyangiaceae bacterium]|nr:hypothetical protein [Polyangiaceae bacterium]
MSSHPTHLNHPTAGPGTSIERAALVEPWQDAEWQRLWLAIQSRPWRTLALIPAGEGASLDFTPRVAMLLSRTGMVHLGKPIQVADATHVPLNQLTAFFNEVARSTGQGERLLVALPPAGKNAITVEIAQASDAVVLCIMNQRMTGSEAKRTVKLIGAARFVGSAIFHPHQVDAAK